MLDDFLAHGRTEEFSGKPTAAFEPVPLIAVEASGRSPLRRSTVGGEPDGLVMLRLVTLVDLMRRAGIFTLRQQFKLSEIEWRIIAQVGQHAPLSLNQLSELLLRDRGQLSRAIKGLVDRGLLKRKRRPGSQEIDITFPSQGRAIYARIVKSLNERDNLLISGVSENDLAELNRITDVIFGKATEMMEKEN